MEAGGKVAFCLSAGRAPSTDTGFLADTGGLKEAARALTSPGHRRGREATSWSTPLPWAPSLPGDKALLGQQRLKAPCLRGFTTRGSLPRCSSHEGAGSISLV